jgi:hypothetical protein
MSADQPVYNPLDKKALAESVADALLEREVVSLGDLSSFSGAGVYVLYYSGPFEAYREIARRNRGKNFTAPIYIGKAIPKGARKGVYNLEAAPGTELFARLGEHSESIAQSSNLELGHFHCRFLVVEDIWIPLGESLLIDKFKPVWNLVLDGFGNHDPGSGRKDSKRSPWDVVHPGRPWAEKLAPNPKSAATILGDVETFLESRFGRK